MNDTKWFQSIFLKYLKRGRQTKEAFVDFFNNIFRLNKRAIYTLKCIEDHELRGAVWVDSKPIPGLINRRVLKMRAGQSAWLRYDEDESFVTLENSRGCVNVPKDVWVRQFQRYYK